jgi:hypothetical protein
MSTQIQLIPIYNSRSDLEAYLVYPYIYSKQGEWIGWVSLDKKIYSVHGHYVGWLSDGPRILRKISDDYCSQKIIIKPPETMTISPLAIIPLAPLMPELSFGTIDVLLEQPDLLPSIDFGEHREDMD